MDKSFAQCPLPIIKAMEQDTLLAYIMNGAILPPDHGFPLRALVPGWVGAASTKWVNKIIVSTRHSRVGEKIDHLQKGHNHPFQTGEKVPDITTQVMKSACCLPWPALLRAGHQKIIGYAWSPFGRIAKVDVSLDGGKNFCAATLSGPNIERAGTRWEFCFDAQPGNLTITPLATDEAGNTQFGISQQKWNEQGYLFGAMTPHPITVSACCGESYSEQDDDSPIMTSGCC
jgi:DMSO/TMAO reductase YedYZ molybdopterin-dependent catalytic subunit